MLELGSSSYRPESSAVLVETDWPRWEFFVVDLRPHPALWEPPTAKYDTMSFLSCLKNGNK
jgi:hypothetical protein